MNTKLVIDVEDLNSRSEIDRLQTIIDNQADSKIYINFSCKTLKPLYPCGILNLIGLSKYVFKSTHNNLKLIDLSEAHFEQFSKLNIFSEVTLEFCENSMTSDQSASIYYDQINVIRLFRISSEADQEPLILFVRDFLEGAYGPSERKKINRLLTFILELSGNCLEHSTFSNTTGEAYFLLENTYIKTSTITKVPLKKTTIVIGDFGIGLKKHLRRKYKLLEDNDLECIEFALITGNTGRLDDSGGVGLGSVKEEVASYVGDFNVNTGNCSYSTINEKVNYLSINNFPGTQFEIILRNLDRY